MNRNLNRNRPEVLAPAGDWECLEAAVQYGADAVYLGGEAFGMRTSAAKFDAELLPKAVDYAHDHSVRVYLTCNTLPTNEEADCLPEFLSCAEAAGVDGLIVADLGVLMEAKKYAPHTPLHGSTQIGVVNYKTATALYEMGVQQVVLARELSLEDIRVIRSKTPPQLKLEAFVHGAVCMSVSGRCLLSQYLVGRDANRGNCAQPCRWGYHLMEEKRPGLYFPIEENQRGSYILNARDLCLIEHLDKLIQVGITSLKIEGRAKSAYYVSVVTNAYRVAVDTYLHDPEHYTVPGWILEELSKVSHRQYHTGFLFGTPNPGQYYESGGYVRKYDIVAKVERTENGRLWCTQRNKFSVGDTLELVRPKQKPASITVADLWNEGGQQIFAAPHPMMPISISYTGEAVEPGSLLRKRIIDN